MYIGVIITCASSSGADGSASGAGVVFVVFEKTRDVARTAVVLGRLDSAKVIPEIYNSLLTF